MTNQSSNNRTPAATHGYIVGMTRSGKSYAAKALTRTVNRTGRPVIVFDPTAASSGKHVNGWTGLVFNNWPEFVATFWANRGCLVVIDEAPDAFRDHLDEAMPMILRGRHQQHVVYMVAQRHTLMNKSARSQANHLIAFVVDVKTAESLAEEWNCPMLRDLHTLPPREFISLHMHHPPQRGRT